MARNSACSTASDTTDRLSLKSTTTTTDNFTTNTSTQKFHYFEWILCRSSSLCQMQIEMNQSRHWDWESSQSAWLLIALTDESHRKVRIYAGWSILCATTVLFNGPTSPKVPLPVGIWTQCNTCCLTCRLRGLRNDTLDCAVKIPARRGNFGGSRRFSGPLESSETSLFRCTVYLHPNQIWLRTYCA